MGNTDTGCKVAFVGSECYPFVKTGGLGDVMYALPRALIREGCECRVILPLYACIKDQYKQQMKYIGSFMMDQTMEGRTFFVGIMETEMDGVIYDFVENREFFDWGNPYTGLWEDIPKYCYFSKASLAVLNYLNTSRMKGISVNVPDVAASFQQAVVDVLVSHAGDAIDQYGLRKFALAGGVAANTALRAGMKEMCEEKGAEFFCPPPILCTDNAAMIGSAAYFEYIKGNFSGLDLNAVPGLRLGQR